MGLLRRKQRKLTRQLHQAAVKAVERLTTRQRSIFNLYYQRPEPQPKLSIKTMTESAGSMGMPKREEGYYGEMTHPGPKEKTKAINDALTRMNERIKKGQIHGEQLEKLGPRPVKAQAKKLKISEQPVGNQNESTASGKFINRRRSNALTIRGGIN